MELEQAATASVQAMDAQSRIVIEHATKYYETKTGRVHALEDFSATIRDGELVCILGPSGCGKSTLLWAMAGLHSLTSGRIIIDGTVVQRPQPQVSMVFQDANMLPWRTVLQNVMFPLEIKGLKKSEYTAHIQELFELVGLDGFQNKYPRELSGGMQQRASLVRCLSFHPSILLMDEPFGALDAFTRDELNLLLLDIWSRTKKTIAFVTHNIGEAIFLADRVLVMSARPGRLAREFVIDLPRPRTLDMTTQPHFIELIEAVKQTIEHSDGRQRYAIDAIA
jgi:NitT/TauT family transport system ATP-binding protein